jgi:hypothetical protein
MVFFIYWRIFLRLNKLISINTLLFVPNQHNVIANNLLD